jgi:hypothetical protein
VFSVRLLLKLATMREEAPEVLQTAVTQRWGPEEVLRSLLQAELRGLTALDPAPTGDEDGSGSGVGLPADGRVDDRVRAAARVEALVPNVAAANQVSTTATFSPKVLIVAVDPITSDHKEMECEARSSTFASGVVLADGRDLVAVSQACSPPSVSGVQPRSTVRKRRGLQRQWTQAHGRCVSDTKWRTCRINSHLVSTSATRAIRK